jgi:hypothetical protein
MRTILDYHTALGKHMETDDNSHHYPFNSGDLAITPMELLRIALRAELITGAVFILIAHCSAYPEPEPKSCHLGSFNPRRAIVTSLRCVQFAEMVRFRETGFALLGRGEYLIAS